MRIKHRHFLRTKEAKKIIEMIKIKYPKLFSKIKKQLEKNNIEIIITNLNHKIYLVNNKPTILELDGKNMIPSINILQTCNEDLPRIVVDMGAIPYIVNGADIMAPGIVKIEGKFNVNDVVSIVDERHNKAIAIGLALVDSEEMKNMKKGKAILNIHHVGDKIWKFLQKHSLL